MFVTDPSGGPGWAAAGELPAPITLKLGAIQRLLVADVADDPTYRALEPQVLDGPDGGGLLLLAYRHDGHLELYAQPQVQVEPSGYEGLGKGVAGIHHTEFRAARFEVTDDGLKLDVAFAAPNGRQVELRIHEQLTGPRDCFPVLAPVGGAFDNPAFFPFIWLPGLSFVPVRGSEVVVRVDGEARTIPRLPLPLGGRRCLMARYDPAVMACELNPHRLDGDPALAGTRVRRDGRTCGVLLEPPLPDMATLAPGDRHEGAIMLQADAITQLRARYELRRVGERVRIVVDRFGPWRSRQRRPLLAVLFRLPVFRRWPTTYHWEATIDLADPDARWSSRWSRTDES
jgi:hypothetical protein